MTLSVQQSFVNTILPTPSLYFLSIINLPATSSKRYSDDVNHDVTMRCLFFIHTSRHRSENPKTRIYFLPSGAWRS